MRYFALLGLVLTLLIAGASEVQAARELRMVVMVSDDPEQARQKHDTLSAYLRAKVPEMSGIKAVIAQDYPHAVKLFQSDKADFMFSGSFVASIFIKKGLAVPVVRPVKADGVSTYRALIVAPEGTSEFREIQDIRGKRIAYCALASSGEIYARSLIAGGEPTAYYNPVIAASHQRALQMLMNGDVDLAVVKNLTYGDGSSYPGTVVIGSDSGENPNNTLIMIEEAYAVFGEEITQALLELEFEGEPAAIQLKNIFVIKGFMKTSSQDFASTYNIIEEAGIDPADFNFFKD